MEISLNTLPYYLRQGNLFRTISKNADFNEQFYSQFIIPDDPDVINSMDEFKNVFRLQHYWDVDEYSICLCYF